MLAAGALDAPDRGGSMLIGFFALALVAAPQQLETMTVRPSTEAQAVAEFEATCIAGFRSLGSLRASAGASPRKYAEDAAATGARTDWTRDEIAALFDLPFGELVFRAQTVHRAHHAPDQVQMSTLLSIKTGGCPEDCGYCNQSVHAETGLKATKLMDVARGAAGGGAGQGQRLEPLLHGRGVAQPQGSRHARHRRDGEGCPPDGDGDLHDARHAEREAGGACSPMPGSITTTTISTPRPSAMRT
jgi:hypothetical protein